MIDLILWPISFWPHFFSLYNREQSGQSCKLIFQDLTPYSHSKALAAFVGVTPKHRLSGTSVKGRTIISRAGHTAARKALYMPGLVAKRHNPVIAAMAKRLEARGMTPKAIVGASMRRLIHMIYGVLKSETQFNAEIPMRGLAIQDGI